MKPKNQTEKEIKGIREIVTRWTGGYLPTKAKRFREEINTFLISKLEEKDKEFQERVAGLREELNDSDCKKYSERGWLIKIDKIIK